jgi:hypothetical protein
MPITARCPNAACGKTLKVKDELAGKKVKCPACASVLTIPSANAAPAASAPPAPARPKPAAKPPAPKPKPPVLEDEEELEDSQKAAPPSRSKPAAKAAAPRGKSPALDEDEELEDTGGATGEEQQETAPTPSGPGQLDKMGQLLWYVGLGTLVLLAVSVFLPWVSVFGFSVKGFDYHAAKIMLVFALVAAGMSGAYFAMKKPVAPTLPGGGMVGVFASVWFLIFILRGGSTGAGIGLWLGLLAALGTAGIFIFLSLRCPYSAPPFNKETMPPFLRKYGVLVSALALGLILGIIFSFVGGASVSISGPPSGMKGFPTR